jgi:hypothetical protein
VPIYFHNESYTISSVEHSFNCNFLGSVLKCNLKLSHATLEIIELAGLEVKPTHQQSLPNDRIEQALASIIKANSQTLRLFELPTFAHDFNPEYLHESLLRTVFDALAENKHLQSLRLGKLVLEPWYFDEHHSCVTASSLRQLQCLYSSSSHPSPSHATRASCTQ